KAVFQSPVEISGKGRYIALRQKSGEVFSRVSVHFFVDAKQAFCETSNVVVTVPICPNILNYLVQRTSRRDRFFCGDRRGLTEIFEESAIETIEDHEMRFVGELFTFARASTEHLLQKYP